MVPNAAKVHEEQLRQKALAEKEKEMAALKKDMVSFTRKLSFLVYVSYLCSFYNIYNLLFRLRKLWKTNFRINTWTRHQCSGNAKDITVFLRNKTKLLHIFCMEHTTVSEITVWIFTVILISFSMRWKKVFFYLLQLAFLSANMAMVRIHISPTWKLFI